MPHAVITGSTGGIGAEIAKILAQEGWSLTLINRSADKAEKQWQEMHQEFPELNGTTISADLMDTESIKRSAHILLEHGAPIDVLYNISGVLTSDRVLSAQGYESHYAVNTLAPYVLTQALRPLLKRDSSDAPSMVVTMSSSAINAVKSLDVDALPQPEAIGGLMGAYATSKMALTVMGSAMAEELRADNILIRSIDPGATMTPMIKKGDGMPPVLRWLAPLLFAPADKQAAKIVRAADPAALGGKTGIFVASAKEKKLPKLVADPAVQKKVLVRLSADH
ncbi:MAG: SDR family NAD(P)-dependent oxidoreductase [Pseudomonadota bacterium]